MSGAATHAASPAITPSDEQARAVAAIVEWFQNSEQQEFLLDGEAGTGKSTTAGFAISAIYRLGYRNILSAAYTGKAAHVMRKKGAEGATTIHQLIYTLTDETDHQLFWTLNFDSPVGVADLVVIDEVSMISDSVAEDLRSFGTKILVLGDVDGQLPPIEGAGAFTRREPDFRLLELNRFALESPIIQISSRARRRQKIEPRCYGDDVEVARLDPQTWKAIYRPDTQVICGTHRTRWTVTQLIRKRFGFTSEFPVLGERVICCRNNRELGLFNGAIGTITGEVTRDEVSGNLLMSIKMDDHAHTLRGVEVHPHLFIQHFVGKDAPRPRNLYGALEFDWAYALTVHKAQGSEWPHVTVIDDSAAFRRDPDVARRWLYTAVSRASDGLLLLQRGG